MGRQISFEHQKSAAAYPIITCSIDRYRYLPRYILFYEQVRVSSLYGQTSKSRSQNTLRGKYKLQKFLQTRATFFTGETR